MNVGGRAGEARSGIVVPWQRGVSSGPTTALRPVDLAFVRDSLAARFDMWGGRGLGDFVWLVGVVLSAYGLRPKPTYALRSGFCRSD